MKNLKYILFSVITTVVFLLLIEWISGFISKNYYIRLDFVNQEYAEEVDGYFKPNQDRMIYFPGQKPYQLGINSLGYRNVGVEITRESIQDKKKVLLVGDSFSFSLFTDDKDSFGYQLQQKLIEEGREDIAVLNAGLGNTSISDFKYYLEQKLPDINPDYIVMNICWNDVQEVNIRPPKYQEYINIKKDPIGIEFRKLNVARLFLKFYSDWKYFRWNRKEKNEKVRDILWKQPKDLDSIFYAYENFRASDVVMNPHQEKLKEDWAKYFKVLGETIDLIQARNIPLLVWISPELASLYERTNGSHELKILAFLDQRGVGFVDVLPAFKQYKEEYLKIYTNPPRDFHLSGYGNQILTQEIYPYLIFHFTPPSTAPEAN